PNQPKETTQNVRHTSRATTSTQIQTRRPCLGISSSGNGAMRQSGEVGSSSGDKRCASPWRPACSGHVCVGCGYERLSVSRSAPQFSQNRLPAGFLQAQFGQVIKVQSRMVSCDRAKPAWEFYPANSILLLSVTAPCADRARLEDHSRSG